MKIALDYDGTYSADPELFSAFVKMALARGHDIRILTMRFPEESLPEMGIPVIYTSRRAKAAEWPADIYIDDNPRFLFLGAE